MSEEIERVNGSNMPKKKSRFKNFFKLNEVGNYFFRGKDSSRPVNFNIRVMHGINRLAIVMFLLGIIYLVIKHLLS